MASTRTSSAPAAFRRPTPQSRRSARGFARRPRSDRSGLASCEIRSTEGATTYVPRLGVDALRFWSRRYPPGVAASGWVRVKVRAAGVCLSDPHLIDGEQTGFRLASGEITPGREISGEADLPGPGVEGPSPGGR
ncbi:MULTISPECIES: alcohol dehydrogenase catalytic domain-containing protein [Streptomyces]|uniref:Alcohol dehydrogenase catalytic domain-containing protein n=2 Tax=Streptomyces TaxID=1883 RepID=A0ABV9J9S8_9ACTN